jgi:ligand-binding SRPBCC domain-containing protein
MKYCHTFQVHAPLETVADFHSQAATMATITPPPVRVQFHRLPERLQTGDEIAFTLWIGPVPINWLARIEDLNPTGFTDRQLRGPMKHWFHRHTFVAIDEEGTQVIDEIDLSLRPHPVWWLVGAGFRLSLPFLFAYRAWKTKRLLEKESIFKPEVK